MTPPKHRLCVYCGSSTGNRPEYAEGARLLGQAMAAQGIGLVYGGGSLGLMGEVARAVRDSGGHVTGIIPDFLVSKERMLEGVSELIVTRTMHERKMGMFERSTGFVALPGGIGTLEELAEILTWAQLQQHARPVILVDILNFWSPLTRMFADMTGNGFIRPGFEVKLDVVKTAAEVIPAYEMRLAMTKDKPPVAILKDKL
ncbi:TIGR00730 family Rossman fold protein [Aestuariivirga sp.]|uniref:LOG family protein n=1 Tax=Aestuariivirga sp. TaxID=2650926 RepID=UPI0039E57444